MTSGRQNFLNINSETEAIHILLLVLATEVGTLEQLYLGLPLPNSNSFGLILFCGHRKAAPWVWPVSFISSNPSYQVDGMLTV